MLNASILSYMPLAQSLSFPLLQFMSQPIDLKTLLDAVSVKKLQGPKQNPLINHLVLHHQHVRANSIFFAIPGNHQMGIDFVDAAIAGGAVAIVTKTILPHLMHVIQIQVADVREAAAQMARVFYHQPDKQLRVVGITGTAGKTTTTWLLRHLYEKCLKEQTGLLGSLEYDLGQRILPASRTTPDVISLMSFLNEMAVTHNQNAIVEVSSHAIDQKRVYGLQFDTVAFTNLSHEHLDYHISMEAYFSAKKQLFLSKNLKHAIVNIDDMYGMRLVSEIPNTVNAITVGIENPAVLQAKNIEITLQGTRFQLFSPYGEQVIKTSLLGKFNVYNILTVLGICYAQGYDLESVIPHLKTFMGIPGRLESVPNKLGINVFIDYAHKPDALQVVLQTLRPLTSKKLYVVFGCGGNRDRSKRPLMMQVAEVYADHIWVTSDNPRTESQQQIFEDMRSGLQEASKVDFVTDRMEAICVALRQCKPGDCLIIAGKGHEQYQEIGQKILPFSDRKVVEAYCSTLL